MENTVKNLIAVVLTLTALTAGCTRDIIQTMNEDSRHGVFREFMEDKPIPPGCAELTVISSLKTPDPGLYPFGSKLRGTKDYMLLIDIDGQKLPIKGDLSKEISGPKGLDSSEAGEGIRYIFKKDLLLKAGVHKLYAALPEDNVAVEDEFVLKEGTLNILQLYPIYGSSRLEGNPGLGLFSSPSFMVGITGFWPYLNGHEI